MFMLLSDCVIDVCVGVLVLLNLVEMAFCGVNC